MIGIIDVARLGLLRLSAAIAPHATRRGRGERGQGMVEYALILVLIAIVVIVIVTVVGQQVNNVFSNISNGLAQ
jgi:pilus assembly protein Flp/PilA